MPKIFAYIVVTMSIRPSASMASLLAMLKDNKYIEIIDHDEVSRRLVIRAPPSEAGYIEMIMEKYADSAMFEIKASIRGRIDTAKLNAIGASYVRGKRLLFFWPCRDGAVLGEQRPRSRVLLKFCRHAQGVDPATVPYSLCSFNPKWERIPTIVERAKNCFTELTSLLGKE